VSLSKACLSVDDDPECAVIPCRDQRTLFCGYTAGGVGVRPSGRFEQGWLRAAPAWMRCGRCKGISNTFLQQNACPSGLQPLRALPGVDSSLPGDHLARLSLLEPLAPGYDRIAAPGARWLPTLPGTPDEVSETSRLKGCLSAYPRLHRV